MKDYIVAEYRVTSERNFGNPIDCLPLVSHRNRRLDISDIRKSVEMSLNANQWLSEQCNRCQSEADVVCLCLIRTIGGHSC